MKQKIKEKKISGHSLDPIVIERIDSQYDTGLTTAQVTKRIQDGLKNTQPSDLTPSIGKIIRTNVCTLFNLINLILAIAVISVGEFKSALFLGVALCNTIMGIVQELRSKKTLDALSILSQSKVHVVRDSQTLEITPDEIVLDDIMVLSTGDQICSDSIVLHAVGFQVNESLLTGESDAIYKNIGDGVMSGSFVTAGTAYVRVNAIGSNNFATSLTVEAKKTKSKKSQLMKTLNSIIVVLTFAILVLGPGFFITQIFSGSTYKEAILGTTASMIGMIPEGLVLLTSVTMTVGAMNLAKKKALVQSLPSIETLARVDVLCLDKTGTITDGTLSFEEICLQNGYTYESATNAITYLMASLHDNNATAIALREKFPLAQKIAPAISTVPFSSARKWSAVSYENVGTYIIGAPNFIFSDTQAFSDKLTHYASLGFRVLCLAYSPNYIQSEILPDDLQCMALIVLSDTIRKEAPETFAYFENEGVSLRVISGDDPLTVSTIASKAGIANSDQYVDMSQFGDDDDFTELVKETVVFGRVSPHQKRGLIQALQKNGKTTCMTGDGVNDVLAMKEADCSVAMINGSDAARSACDFVLMSSDFSAMINVMKEGRRVINNIETVSTMYLVKTIYSTLLTLLYILFFFTLPNWGLKFPFLALQMGPINSFTVGIPSFFLSLRANYKRPEGRFIANVLEISLPAAIAIVICVLFNQGFKLAFGISFNDMSSINVLLAGTITLFLLTKVAKPFDRKIILLTVLSFVAFYASFFLLGWFYEFTGLLSPNAFFYIPLISMGSIIFISLSHFMKKRNDHYFAKQLQSK